jgi:hypothetical protein
MARRVQLERTYTPAMTRKKGMDSAKLSARRKQPGHDVTFRVAENNFIIVAERVLDKRIYKVVDHPTDLSKIFKDEEGALGVVPEASIENQRTGKKFYVEVKKQGPIGNAEERAFKHHTAQFYKVLKKEFGYSYHPFVTVYCESLATDRKYTTKAKYLFEPDNYFLWKDYDEKLLKQYLQARCTKWLD